MNWRVLQTHVVRQTEIDIEQQVYDCLSKQLHMCGLEMPKKPVLDLVLKFRVGHEDVSVPVIGEDDALLLVSVVNDHLVVICLILHKE